MDSEHLIGLNFKVCTTVGAGEEREMSKGGSTYLAFKATEHFFIHISFSLRVSGYLGV